jgi:hypothetical protein
VPAPRPETSPHARQWLTPAQERKARRLFARRVFRDDVAAAIGVTPERLTQRLRDQLADVRVGRGGRGGKARQADPTPEEIAAQLAAIREGWDDATRAERWVGRFAGPVDTDSI